MTIWMTMMTAKTSLKMYNLWSRFMIRCILISFWTNLYYEFCHNDLFPINLFLLSLYLTCGIIAWFGCEMNKALIFFHALYELWLVKITSMHCLCCSVIGLGVSSIFKGFWLSLLSLQIWCMTQFWGRLIWIYSWI